MESNTSAPYGHLQSRQFGTVNWLGVRTLYLKEVQRFFKVFLQTIVAPAVTTLIFLAIFALVLGGQDRTVNGLPFLEFLAPGLVMMAILQNSFANTASSVLVSKIQGNIVDILMPPLSAGELTFALAMGGVTRGALVAVTIWLALLPFAPMSIAHFWAVLYFALSAALTLSLMGLLTGICAEKFDHMATVTNFVIMPLSFLSGTFYSIDLLPDPWHTISQLNPFFYLIDGLRYGFIDHAEGALAVGVAVSFLLNIGLWMICHRILRSGYKLKA
ncbi:MAG TPA: multidrug ABC transporter permease [Sneathiellales bacterium]|jgi:ABC-2 type transport system permease protein|nr:multidrug ABC transporter permease [Sneathiellales bacterium]